MYGIFTNIYPKNGPNVGKYYIYGAYGYAWTSKLYNLKPGWNKTSGRLHLQERTELFGHQATPSSSCGRRDV